MGKETIHFFGEDAEIVPADKPEEKKEPEDTNAEKKENENIHERLGLIIRSISNNMDLEVTTDVDPRTLMEMASQGQDAHKKWYRLSKYDPKTKEFLGEFVHIPREILENEEVAKGKAAHEAGHVVITRQGEIVPDKVMQELGFHSIIAAAEERPTDQVVRDRYPGAGEWVDSARKDSLKEGEEMCEKMGKNLASIPKFAQLSSLIVYAPQYEELPAHIDPEVSELYKKIQKDVEAVEHALPHENASEEEIVEKAKERYRIIYKKIWPEAKKLVEDDKKNEALKQMVKDGLASSTESKLNALDNLSDDQKKELLESIIEIKKSDGKDAKDTMDVPLDALSEELLQALEKIFLSLPRDKQVEIVKKAIRSLEDIEDSLVKEYAGKISDDSSETHEEHREKKELKDEEEKSKKKSEEELKKIDKDIEKLESTKDIYEQTYQEVQEYDEELYRRLEDVFRPNVKRKTKLTSTGAHINLPAVYRWEAQRGGGAPAIDNKIFETAFHPEKKDYAVTLLIDLSGSMRGERIKETFKAVVLLTEVLNRLGVRNEILGFQDELISFKKFEENLNDDIRKKISGMHGEVMDNNLGGHNKSSYNDDGPCLSEASESLAQESAKEKFLLSFSDGEVAGRKSDEGDLVLAVKKILKTTDQKLVGLGLGSGTEHVKKYFPTSLPNIDIKKLVEALGGLLEDMINNPQHYSYGEKK